MGSLVNGFGYMSHASSSHSRNSSMASSAFGGAGGEYDQQLLHQSPQSGGNMLLPTSPDKNAVSSGGMGSVVQLGSSPVGQGGGTPGTVWYATPDGEMVERKPIARLRAPVQPPSSTPASSNLRHPPMEAADANTPTLYRTSQLPSVTMDGSSNIATKAVLKFDGDLNNMALGWSHDEWHAKRRLVLFTRSQEGGTINAAFRPVTLQEITPNTIVISCIFREDKNECYVTSVDTIYLLEALVSVRFTVEEKNRIRRNLEGYKPLTITKAKQDCEEFFKVIMGFPNPKPRNIEKDVKVFPWKILANALKKIISKYSASYLKPEEMVGPGKLPPQPIGWAPGRTPPPTATPLPSAAGTAGSSNNAFSQRPPGTAGSSSSLSMSPSMRNEMLPSSFHTSLSSSSLNNGLHTSTLDSVAEDEPMSPDSAAAAALASSTTTFSGSNNNRNGNHHNLYYQQEDDKTIIPEYAAVPSDLSNLELAAAAAATAASGDNNFDPALMGPSTEGTDELATPNANYDNANPDTDANPFRFS